MKAYEPNTKASNITNYQAVNCSGEELGIVEGFVKVDHREEPFVVLSTHHKDLFGDIKYAVPFYLCDTDDENKTIWLDLEKNELEFLYKLTNLYENRYSSWDDEFDQFFNIDPNRSSRFGNQNMNC